MRSDQSKSTLRNPPSILSKTEAKVDSTAQVTGRTDGSSSARAYFGEKRNTVAVPRVAVRQPSPVKGQKGIAHKKMSHQQL